MSNPSFEADMSAVSQALLARARKCITGRNDRVLLFAWALRRALDELPPEDRSAEFVPRTWAFPELAPSSQKVLAYIWELFGRTAARPITRCVVLERVTQLAIDDLSPDEQSRARVTAKQIIGTIRGGIDG